MIAIIDYGMGNLRSVQKSLERLGVEAIVTSDPDLIRKASKLILPGVGHFAMGMNNLNQKGLSEIIQEEVVKKNKPLLGICLGMQLLTCYSEEGDVDGLGLIEAQTLRFPSFNWDFHVPHMGWNKISPVKESKLCYGIDCKSLMYFVHTYYVKCADSKDILFKTKYGVEFDSGFEHENIAGFQFHPEKSHKAGLQLLQNFIKK